jgi:hypothetical protein
MMTGQVISHPEQVIYRATLFGWYDYSNPMRIPVYADGTWRANVESGEYGLIYFGAKKEVGPQPYIYPKREEVNIDFSLSGEMSVPVGVVPDFVINVYSRCQPVCHGPYYYSG